MKFLGVLDKVLDRVVLIFLLVLGLYVGYSIYDIWLLNHEASISAGLVEYKPVKEDDTISFEELLKINSDVVGWVTIEGTNIDYPIVQGIDNLEYVNKNVYGEFSLPGSIFLDCRNSSDFKDFYSIVYGHNMYGDYMFGCLEKFLGKSYLDSHVFGELVTKESRYGIEWLTCTRVSAYDEIVFSPLRDKSKDLLRVLGVEDIPEEKLIALSTCSDNDLNGRVLLIGKILNSGG